MQKQPNLEISRSQIAVELITRSRRKDCSGFDLYHQDPIDDDIDSLATKSVALVEHVDQPFALDDMSALLQLEFQCELGDVFAMSETKRVVGIVESSDYRTGEVRVDELAG